MEQGGPSGGRGFPRISRFLAEHQACDGSLRVERERPGGPRLRIICEGCGRVISHSAGEAADHGLPGLPRAEPGPAARRPAGSGAGDRSRVGRGWRLLAVAGGVLALAAAAVAIARDDGDDGTPESQRPVIAELAEEPPAPAPAEMVKLARRTFLDLFAIGVPKGWRSATSGTEVELVAGGAEGRIAIFHQPGERPPAGSRSRLPASCWVSIQGQRSGVPSSCGSAAGARRW